MPFERSITAAVEAAVFSFHLAEPLRAAFPGFLP
jgi:hypothetical protein